MKVEQLYTNCLAQGAYYIESNGEVAIIDPLREVQQYVDMANARNAKIKYIFETHFHADFVSGHQDLAALTGATIVYGPTTMKTGFEAYIGKDNEEFKLGKATIKLLHTPGHTIESSTYLLINENGKEEAIFTGDTLFIGDVGRPDLAQKVIAELTEVKLAKMLFHSLRTKIMPLNDNLIVYPAHGAGSACGKNMSKETSDTLGNQKKTNYALREDMTEEEFLEEVLNGLTPPPAYFPQNVLLNIHGYENIEKVVENGVKPLSVEAVELLMEEVDAIIVDTRKEEEFIQAHIPNSTYLGIDGNFATWLGTIIKDVKQPIIIVADEGREVEVATRMARIGFDNGLGFLKGGIEAWKNAGKSVATIPTIDAETFSKLMNEQEINVVDVRRKSEFESHHIIGATNSPLDYYEDNLASISKNDKQYVHCAGGYRSLIFISLLKAKGFTNLVNVAGGFKAIEEGGKVNLTKYVCPTTLL